MPIPRSALARQRGPKQWDDMVRRLERQARADEKRRKSKKKAAAKAKRFINKMDFVKKPRRRLVPGKDTLPTERRPRVFKRKCALDICHSVTRDGNFCSFCASTKRSHRYVCGIHKRAKRWDPLD